MQVEPPLAARVTLPPWLWGGNPQGLLAESESEYQSRADGGSFLVRTDESYFRRKPDLVERELPLGVSIGR